MGHYPRYEWPELRTRCWLALDSVLPLHCVSLGLMLTLYAHENPSTENVSHAVAAVCFAVFAFLCGVVVVPVTVSIDYQDQPDHFRAKAIQLFGGVAAFFIAISGVRMDVSPVGMSRVLSFCRHSQFSQLVLAIKEMHSIRVLLDAEFNELRTFQQQRAFLHQHTYSPSVGAAPFLAGSSGSGGNVILPASAHQAADTVRFQSFDDPEASVPK